jgi:hypothetical protein
MARAVLLAGTAFIEPQSEQSADLPEREAELLGVLDEAQAVNRTVGKHPVARQRARRAREEPTPLIIANGVAVDAGTIRRLANRKPGHRRVVRLR